jgi:hypothetical protein
MESEESPCGVIFVMPIADFLYHCVEGPVGVWGFARLPRGLRGWQRMATWKGRYGSWCDTLQYLNTAVSHLKSKGK